MKMSVVIVFAAELILCSLVACAEDLTQLREDQTGLPRPYPILRPLTEEVVIQGATRLDYAAHFTAYLKTNYTNLDVNDSLVSQFIDSVSYNLKDFRGSMLKSYNSLLLSYNANFHIANYIIEELRADPKFKKQLLEYYSGKYDLDSEAVKRRLSQIQKDGTPYEVMAGEVLFDIVSAKYLFFKSLDEARQKQVLDYICSFNPYAKPLFTGEGSIVDIKEGEGSFKRGDKYSLREIYKLQSGKLILLPSESDLRRILDSTASTNP